MNLASLTSAALSASPTGATSPGVGASLLRTVQDAAAMRPSASDRDRTFADLLRKAGRPERDTRTDEQRARAAAEQFVAITFVQPLLKELRSTTFAAPPFAPGQAEKQFQSIADQALADRIVQASNWPLVDRLTSDLLKRSAASKTPQPGAVEGGDSAGLATADGRQA